MDAMLTLGGRRFGYSLHGILMQDSTILLDGSLFFTARRWSLSLACPKLPDSYHVILPLISVT